MPDHDTILAALLEIRKRCTTPAEYQAAVERLAASLDGGNDAGNEGPEGTHK
jgi:hypothetical protein